MNIIILACIHFSCNKKKVYLNISPDVNYVGMNQCAACHQDHYHGFIQTGMGKSFRPALKEHSDLDFSHSLYDSNLDLHYNPYFIGDSLFIKEYQIDELDTTHYLHNKVDYIIGSGHHTNSHLFENNGYLYQMPFTYYIQDSILDFPPGFENNQNSRFSRKMGLECVACHNAYPQFVLGSENKYTRIPTGIDCERCHGPGELHIEKIKNNDITDTIFDHDYTIVNPSNLSIELQNDLCARCHLQGNAVLINNKSFFDFLPGMYLKEVMDVYVPRYSNSDDEFIMASHVDRMKLSKCYTNSNELLACIDCHNPHKSVKNVSVDFFNSRCLNCHSDNDCDENQHEKNNANNNCVSCHMPNSKTLDIPHVKITDHKIGIYREDTLQNDTLEKKFLGLECVNNKQPTKVSVFQAYLQQYERFDPHSYYLDSAAYYLETIDLKSKQGLYMHVYYLFLKQDYSVIIEKVDSIGLDFVLNSFLINKDYGNKDAWTSYRIGESFMKMKDVNNALMFYEKAVRLAPYNLEFRNKYGVTLFTQNKVLFAKDEFEFIINEDNGFVSAYTNLGYVYLLLDDKKNALDYYNYALLLDPNHEQTLVNKAELLLLDKNKKDAFICLEKVLLINPNNKDAAKILDFYEL